MANFNKKNWLSAGESGATYSNSVLSKENMNDLESRIENFDNNVTKNMNNMSKSETIKGCDFNELSAKQNGLFVAYGPCKNSPTDENVSTMHWFVIQIYYQESYCIQIAFKFFTTDENIYIRRKQIDWREWKKFTPVS